MTASDKLWGGRFGPGGGRAAEAFTASLDFDRRLYRYDIAGSIVHARMLARVGVLTAEEAERIVRGLEAVREEIEAGTFPFRREYEDIHLNVERRLIELIGPVGGKLHTGRSRNDQVALDMHLYAKEAIARLQERLRRLQAILLRRAEEEVDTLMPGYTHLQHAQPVLLAYHLLAYFFMFQRDRQRLADCLRRTDVMPLGAGALAGTSFPIDRRWVAAELGFRDVYANGMDAVSDRDYLLELLAAAAIVMVHVSRLCEELVLWSSREFGFVEFDDAHATGSSMMPQKKNPDVAELARGKAGRVFGHLVGLLTVVKALPLAYHTDLQEDKEAVFDAVDTVEAVLEALAGALETLRFRRRRLEEALRGDFANATDAADYLVRRGLPFREAHAVVGQAVRLCLESGRALEDLTPEEWRRLSPLVGDDIREVLSPRAVVAARRSEGGTAPERVREQLALAAALLADGTAE
ncbi:MAG: argininosuccinate lyase [Clostridia bacterium]|nr:argininosuccinate lyase [Clostridia bacterium]